METDIAEMLFASALGSALPYAVVAAAEWLRRNRLTHRTRACAPTR